MSWISYSSAKDLKRDGLAANGHDYSLAEARKLLSVRALRARDLVHGSDMDGVALKRRRLELDCKLREFDLEIARSEWVRKAIVVRDWKQKSILLCDQLKALGRTVAPLCFGRTVAEIETIIRQRVFEILRLLAHAEYCPTTEAVFSDPLIPKEAL
jgi:hypothetical protein